MRYGTGLKVRLRLRDGSDLDGRMEADGFNDAQSTIVSSEFTRVLTSTGWIRVRSAEIVCLIEVDQN